MKSIFAYDSPLMQILSYIGDMIILNFVFLLCCCPIFTIGAAQAGMYTAMRVLNDKEDDSSPLKAFFRGFTGGFLKVSIAWNLLFAVVAVMSVVGLYAYAFGLPAWACLVPICIAALFQSLVPAFHSRFECSPWQLIRNSWFLAVAHPLRSVGTALLIWIPVIVLLWPGEGIKLFMFMTPVWGTIYYSTALLFSELFLRKPFKTLIDDFNARHETEEEPESQKKLEEAEANKIFHDVPSK